MMTQKDNGKDSLRTSFAHGTHSKQEIQSNPMMQGVFRHVSNGRRMAPLATKRNAPFSNRTKSTNRQKPKKRK